MCQEKNDPNICITDFHCQKDDYFFDIRKSYNSLYCNMIELFTNINFYPEHEIDEYCFFLTSKIREG